MDTLADFGLGIGALNTVAKAFKQDVMIVRKQGTITRFMQSNA